MTYEETAAAWAAVNDPNNPEAAAVREWQRARLAHREALRRSWRRGGKLILLAFLAPPGLFFGTVGLVMFVAAAHEQAWVLVPGVLAVVWFLIRKVS